MINVQDISKRYGNQQVLQHICFQMQNGRVLGLLGRNGAGKSTTMNIMTGYLQPTSGYVHVDNLPLNQNACEARSRIGYLPEIPPLYPEMTVREYLRFVCALKRVERRVIPLHMEQLMNLTSITNVAGKQIGHLSKGYRQRVGLAQALAGNPPYILLDEPTVGLDPEQRVEMRELIRSLRQDHAILLSSHILSDIETVCDDIAILHRGCIVTQGPLVQYTHREDQLLYRLTIRAAAQEAQAAVQGLSGVEKAELLESAEDDVCCLEVCSRRGMDSRDELFDLLRQHGWTPLALVPQQSSLEQFFLNATGEGERAE